MASEKIKIGDKIRKIREEKKITQKELAERLGTSQQNLAQYENGKRNPKIKTLQKIADALEIPVSELYEGSELLQSVKPVIIRPYRMNREKINFDFSNVDHTKSDTLLADIIAEMVGNQQESINFKDFTDKTQEIIKTIHENYTELNEKGHIEADKHLQYASEQIKMLSRIPEFTEEKEAENEEAH